MPTPVVPEGAVRRLDGGDGLFGGRVFDREPASERSDDQR
jgi:hypothetical protein